MTADLDPDIVVVKPERLFDSDRKAGGKAEDRVCPVGPGEGVGLEIHLEAADLDQSFDLLRLPLPRPRRLSPVVAKGCIECGVLIEDPDLG